MAEGISAIEALRQLGQDIDLLDHYVEANASEELLDFRPGIEDAWTIREHLSHMMDVEVVYYVWLRRAIAESGVEVWAPSAMRSSWLSDLNYAGQNPADIVVAFKAIRKLNFDLLDRVRESDWDKPHVIHPQAGKLSLRKLAQGVAGHIANHRMFLERNEKVYWEQEG